MTLNNDNNNECCKCTTPEIYIELNQQGPQGRQGNPGVDGVSPEVTVVQNTNTSYVLKIEDTNGSFTTPNLKANLPLGGVDGQMLVKLSNEDGVVGWEGDIDNLVTLDGEQNITGNKTFSNNTVFNNYIQTQLLDGEDDTPTTIIGVENYHQNVDNPPALMFGNPGHNTLLKGTTLEAKVGDDYYSLLHQGNVLAGDNITIDKTSTGITISSTGGESYVLPQANATTLGGIKANEKTDEDTQAVNIDPATGLLYTKAGGGESPDSLNVYQLQYGAQSGSIPVTFDGNNITIKSGIPISTPNGTFSYTSDITYQYDFVSERTIFAYKDDTDESYYNMLEVHYGGSQPATNANGQIAWFDNGVWKMISATGEVTAFSTEQITPIAHVYLSGASIESIDYASYYKINIELPDNVITSDNISQNEYIKQLEARIVALETALDGGNAQTDEPAVLKASNVDLGVYPTNNIYSTNENITIE